MDPLLPTDPETSALRINEFLVTWSGSDPNLYVHPKVLSFNSAKDKTNWQQSLPDIAGRDVLSNFIKNGKPDSGGGSKRCWLALLSAPFTGETEDEEKGSWVGRK
jgi:hypothetical protein